MKIEMILLFAVISAIFLSSGIFAEVSCSVQNTPCTSSDYTMMKLSDATNAHGELKTQGNYNYYVCCNFPGGDASCSADGNGDGNPDNKVLGLSSQTNAHAEIPSGTTYTGNDVCYGDLSCANVTNESTNYYIPIVSLSASTNAHISPPGAYEMQIRCRSPQFAYAFWSKNGFTKAPSTVDVVPGTTEIFVVVRDTGLSNGTSVTFEIYDKDAITGDDLVKTLTQTIESGKAMKGWKIMQNELDSDPIFYFKVLNGGALVTTSGDLTINVLDANFCEGKNLCGNYIQANCANDPCNLAKNSVPSGIDCSDPFTKCSCEFNSVNSRCEGTYESITYNEGIEESTGSCIITADESTDDCSDGSITWSWVATWTGEGSPPASCNVGPGSETAACPAQVQLPLFGFYNFLAAGLLITIIYLILLNFEKIKNRKTKRRVKLFMFPLRNSVKRK